MVKETNDIGCIPGFNQALNPYQVYLNPPSHDRSPPLARSLGIIRGDAVSPGLRAFYDSHVDARNPVQGLNQFG